MTRTAVAIRHVSFEDLGLLAPLLAAHGYAVTTLDAGVDDLGADLVRDADLLVMLGGPIGLSDRSHYPVLDTELGMLARRLRDGAPTLGICLGAQLIAAALGADVHPSGVHEIGYAPVRLTPTGSRGPLGSLAGVPVLHWHGDTFDLPAGAILLAGTPAVPHQAFCIGDAILALQFHLEAQHRRIEQWLIGHADELAAHALDPRDIRRDAARLGPGLEAAATRAFEAWLTHLG
jgi:GMP synthase (glutamine-hydrolysing)